MLPAWGNCHLPASSPACVLTSLLCPSSPSSSGALSHHLPPISISFYLSAPPSPQYLSPKASPLVLQISGFKGWALNQKH